MDPDEPILLKCTLTWTVSNVLSYFDTQYEGPSVISSQTFHPNCIDDINFYLECDLSKESDFYPVYLKSNSLNDFSELIEFRLSTLDINNNQQNSKVFNGQINQNDLCGFLDFITKEDLINKADEFLCNGNLLICCELKVYKNPSDINLDQYVIVNFKEPNAVKPLYNIEAQSESLTHLPVHDKEFNWPIVQFEHVREMISNNFSLTDNIEIGFQLCHDLWNEKVNLNLVTLVKILCSVTLEINHDNETYSNHYQNEIFQAGDNALRDIDINKFKSGDAFLETVDLNFKIKVIERPENFSNEINRIKSVRVPDELVQQFGPTQRQSGLPFDVILRFPDGAILLAHSTALMHKSPVFRDFFHYKPNVIPIYDVAADVFEAFLEIVYYGTISSTYTKIAELLFAADKYGLNFTEVLNLESLDQHKMANNALHLSVLGLMHNSSILVETSKQYLGNEYAILDSPIDVVFKFRGNSSLRAHREIIMNGNSELLKNVCKYADHEQMKCVKTSSGEYVVDMSDHPIEGVEAVLISQYFAFFQKTYCLDEYLKRFPALEQFLPLSTIAQQFEANMLPTGITDKHLILTFRGNEIFISRDHLNYLASKSNWSDQYMPVLVRMIEDGRNRVKICDLPHPVLQEFIQLEIDGNDEFYRENLSLKLIAADFFEMNNSKIEYESELCMCLSIDTAVDLLLLGHRHSKVLKDNAINYICKFPGIFVRTDQLQHLYDVHPDLVSEIEHKLKSKIDPLKNDLVTWMSDKVANDSDIALLSIGGRKVQLNENLNLKFVTEILCSIEFEELVERRDDLHSEIRIKFNENLTSLKNLISGDDTQDHILARINASQFYNNDSVYTSIL